MIDYYLITKPGIIIGNLITFTAGFLLGTSGAFSYALFSWTLLGLALVIASSSVFNNYIDRQLDSSMERTKGRALAKGSMPAATALLYGTLLGCLGIALLALFTPPLSAFLAFLGFAIYVFLYTPLKGKTIFATAIGSVAGALPPVIGYVSAKGTLDLAALLLFCMLILWQMPHFYAIALMHLQDYRKANLPLLPLVRGAFQTKLHMALYVMAFLPFSLLFSFFGYTGLFFLLATALLGTLWIALAVQGLKTNDDVLWSRRMFCYSLLIMAAISLLLPLDKI